MPGSTSKRLSETDLKCLYLEHLRRLGQIDANSIIASEYFLGRTGRRADLAILNSEFIGIEFKSKSDSLKRLKPQLEAYVQCFDRVILVTDERHIAGALPQITASVELWSVNSEGQFTLVQKAKLTKHQSARALAQLCTIRYLRRLTPATLSIRSRNKLTELAMQLPIDAIYRAATTTFKAAFSRSSTAFWSELGSRRIDDNSLAPLSRFAEAREKQTLALKRQSDFWQAWAEEAANVLRPRQDIATTAH